jgi:hypothetical protein
MSTAVDLESEQLASLVIAVNRFMFAELHRLRLARS